MSVPDAISASIVESPTETPDIAFPKIIPKIGMKYCASHQGSVLTTKRSVYDRNMAADVPMQLAICKNMPCSRKCCKDALLGQKMKLEGDYNFD